ncbi:hypothetical protein ACRALDRAFT_1061618 [Sodiomyces alcalophilus JCM 7366]|uniref:uncharacterized protein n=1 Tax=Sodiomyces alcalophilus JCM 7366 TaxID=591952 RepID=UPI0039B697B9
MRFLSILTVLGASAYGALAWGSLGHVTTAYLASHLVSNSTEAFFQNLLRDETSDYLGKVATWADTIRYTRWGRFTSVFHFIDAKDEPPTYCGVELARDCKPEGCVVTALANYTARLLDPELPAWERNQAARFVVHFVGDIHQPLHDENVARGGNGIYVLWQGRRFNLHYVWDSAIAERLIGRNRRKPYDNAKWWAEELAVQIREGKFVEEKEGWLKDVDIDDATATALAWAREGNAYVCSHVLPEGPLAIEGQELSGEYYDKAAPVVELQIARAGYRMAAWLDLIARRFQEQGAEREEDLWEEL